MKIAIIGAGPGGLSAGLLLAHEGYDVTIYEKDQTVGGRSKGLSLGEYHFDAGPTFLVYIDKLKEVFKRVNENVHDHIDLILLRELYRIHTPIKTLTFTNNLDENAKVIEEVFNQKGMHYKTFMKEEEKRFILLDQLLNKPYTSPFNLLRKEVIQARKTIKPKETIDDRLKRFFDNETLRSVLSFQSKYLGMSPLDAPGIFTMLTYLEHAKGLYHVRGGLNKIHQKMADLFIKKGGKLRLNHKVKSMVIKEKTITTLIFENHQEEKVDIVINNSDVTYMMDNLLERKKYQKRLSKFDYSLSTFNLYLGIKKTLDLSHHTLYLPENYALNAKKITRDLVMPEDLMVYIHNPSAIDPTLAPEGHSSLYALIPVPNTLSNIDYKEQENYLRKKIITKINTLAKTNIEPNIVKEKIISPTDWENDFNVYHGAVFSLSHSLNQMLHKRPNNHFKPYKNLYLVGGGTHPGSGLPTIYQSALITVDLIKKRLS